MKLLSFSEFFMQEGIEIPLATGTLPVDKTVKEKVNSDLVDALAQDFLTPYIAVEKVRQTLVPYSIFLEGNTLSMDGDTGSITYAIMQFGGIVDDPHKAGLDTPAFFIHLSWSYNPDGTYAVWAELVDEEELQALLDDEELENENVEEAKQEKPGITWTKIGQNTHYFFEFRGFRWDGTAWDKKDAYSKGMDAYEKHLGHKGLKEEDIDERTLTAPEKKKKEEVAQAIEREHPGIDMSKKMAIATATAKKSA